MLFTPLDTEGSLNKPVLLTGFENKLELIEGFIPNRGCFKDYYLFSEKIDFDWFGDWFTEEGLG